MDGKSALRHFLLLPAMVVATAAIMVSPAAKGADNVGSSPWVWQNPLPQGNNLNSISCPTSSTCFAVGDLGTILVTTNAGRTWFPQSSPATQNLRGISCPGTSFCVAVGDGATVLTYRLECFIGRPCESAWSLQTTFLPDGVALRGVSCTNTTTCFAVGGNSVYDNLQGGSGGWNVIGSVNSGDSLTGISCPGATNTPTCFAVGPVVGGSARGQLLKIFYGFNGFFDAFQLAVLATSDANSLTSISCTSAITCVAVDRGGNSVSTFPTFSLLSWDIVVLQSNLQLSGVSCLPGTSTCYAVGFSNLVFSTSNGGSSWSSSAVSGQPRSGAFSAVSCNSSACVAVGFGGASATNSLGAWSRPQPPLAPGGLIRVRCPVQGTCFAVGIGGAILYTDNGGANWTPQTSPTTQNLADISCASISACVAVGANGTIIGYNGSDWSRQSSGTTQNLNAVSCPSTQDCFAAGTGIIATNDGGTTPWITQLAFGTVVTVNGIACVSTTNCVTVGQLEQTRKTSDGRTWSTPPVTECEIIGGTKVCPPTLRDVSCPQSTTCVAVGDRGTILIVSNVWTASETVKELTSPTADNLASVSCLAQSSGMICEAATGGFLGTHQILLGSGSTWTVEATLEAGGGLFGISCAGNYQCLAVGSSGVIVSKTSGNTGTGELTPRDGSSDVGELTTFSLTWTVPSGQSWRNLQSVDLRLIKDADIALWARFIGGGQNAVALLDAAGDVIAEGVAGDNGELDSPTATLDLTQSSFQGSGPSGPSVTINFVVSFKPAAGGNAETAAASRPYEVEIGATNTAGTFQAPERVGNWVVHPVHH